MTDTGNGLTTAGRRDSGGRGLRGMRERAAAYGGTSRPARCRRAAGGCYLRLAADVDAAVR